MACSNTPSGSWVDLYNQQNYPLESITSSATRGAVTDATVVSTITDAILVPNQVSRPIRRRPRASRRNPTTVLNTDPTNFRAMVQQFTGGYANTTSPYPMLSGSSMFNLHGGTGVTGQQNIASEAVYRNFPQPQQQQQQIQDGPDSNDAFLTNMMIRSGSEVLEDGETFGR